MLENHSPEELVDTALRPRDRNGGEPHRLSFAFTLPALSLERMKEMTVEDLLALFDAGNEEAMVAKMNDYVKNVCPDTHYTALYGYAEGQYTTGADTLALVNRMLKDPCLSKIWSTREYTFHFPDSGQEHTVYTANYLFDNHIIPGFDDLRVTGGFDFYRGTASSVCPAQQDGKEVLCILLGAERKFKENVWQVVYYGNYEETRQLLNAVLGQTKQAAAANQSTGA